MAAEELRIGNRAAYFRKTISAPDFESDRVLVRDAFEFTSLWLKRNCQKALPYWLQSKAYYEAGRSLPTVSAPLTNYYCFLNATKALLTVKKAKYSDYHGVSGDFNSSRRALINERISFHGGGVMASLANYLGENNKIVEYNLKEILSNLPFIHRAFRYTYRSHPEMFTPARRVIYRRHPTDRRIWLSANVDGRFADTRSLRTLPPELEVDKGFRTERVIRTKQRIRWFGRGETDASQKQAILRLNTFHHKNRKTFVYISASPDLWYIKRKVAGSTRIDRYSMTLIMAGMHRLSELSRYDPAGLTAYFEGKENWLLAEFVELSPAQFIDEIVCEMTSLEFGLPGIRPRST